MKITWKSLICLLLVICLMAQVIPATAVDLLRETQQEEAVQETAEEELFDPSVPVRTTTKLPSKADKFTDVREADWFYDPVCYVTDHEIFIGTSETTFTPNGSMTRAMVVTVLARMAGVDTEEYTEGSGFSDVVAGSWYEPAVAWAARFGIVNGTGNGKFSPDTNVSRQDMAVMFVRYFTLFGVSPGDEIITETEPKDFSAAGDYAKESILILWQRGLVGGNEKGSFEPRKDMTRAECATLCMRIHKAVEEWKDTPGNDPWHPVKPGTQETYTVTFQNTEGKTITSLTAQVGLGLGDKVPYYAHPDVDGGDYFWGWFFYNEDGELCLFNTLYPYNKDMTVFALCGTQSDIVNYLEDECYFIEEPVAQDYTITIRPIESGTEFDENRDFAMYADDFDIRVEYSVETDRNGDSVISVYGLKPGATYNVVLSDRFVFVVTDENGNQVELSDIVRYIQFVVEKPVNAQLYFRHDIVWLPTSDAVFYSQLGIGSGFGTERAADDTETELGSGIFSYNPYTCEYRFEVGTVICVYSDDKVPLSDADGNPIEVQRLAPNVRDYDEAAYEGLGYTYADLYGDAEDTFYIVTQVTQSTDFRIACTYRELGNGELNMILYIPDVIPYLVSELPERAIGSVGTIENYAAYDVEMYSGYSKNEAPKPQVNDFVILYTSDIDYYSDADFKAIRAGRFDGEIPYLYGRITAVDGMKLTYEVTTSEEVVNAIDYIDDYYIKRYIPRSMMPEITEEDMEEFSRQTMEMLDEEAIRAFVATAIDEDAKLNDEDAKLAKKILENNEIECNSASAGALRAGKLPDDSKKIEVTGTNASATIDTTHLSYLPNTEGKWNLSFNMGFVMIVKLRLREGVNLYYVISANFTQELSIGLSASGRFDVKWYLCVPVPKRVEFGLSVITDTATDVTLDIRHYTVDKSHYGVTQLYGRQADCQELWNNYQDFLLSAPFINHGAALFNKEAEYYTLVSAALAIPEDQVSARAAAEFEVIKKAKEINAMWTDTQYHLDSSWKQMFSMGGSQEFSDLETEAAKKTAEEAKNALIAKVQENTQNMGFITDISNKLIAKATKKTEEAYAGMQELADLDEDGKETEAWKDSQKALEAAKKAEEEAAEKQKKITQGIDTALKVTDELLKNIVGRLTAAKVTAETVQAQMRIDSVGNAEVIEKAQKVIDGLDEAIGICNTARRFIGLFTDIYSIVKTVMKLSESKDGMSVDKINQYYNIFRSLNATLKDCKLIMGTMQTSFFKPGDGDYERCQDGIEVILTLSKVTDTICALYEKLAKMAGIFSGSMTKTDGITGVPTTTNYWKFRLLRLTDFTELSLNTEILDNLNGPDKGIDDDNIKVLADKYAQMCKMTNTWMDLYRKKLFKDVSIPVFAGLDVTIGADFVVQANVNIAANFNFRVIYGKEFRISVDVLDWDISTNCYDRINQKLSVSVIAMGTLGFRIGFEVTIGLKIIKIFTVGATFEIMPYVSLYAYAFFQYTRDLSSGAEEAKLKGALYVDFGIHFGINLMLKMDILVYKNTWKWNLYNKNISLKDIGERRNVYNFSYLQASPDALVSAGDGVKTAQSGSGEDKAKLNTETDGLMIVNSSTDYKLPGAARMMSFMDMTDGSLGKLGFDAGHYDYTFFTVPHPNDGGTYPTESNLPVIYKLVEVPKTDAEGNIIYKENDGAGIPVEITLDIDESGYEKDYIIAANKGTPETEWVESDQLIIDMDGIKEGKYVEDTRFSADKNGKITYTPEVPVEGIYAQDVYVLLEWREGSLEFSNYPIRRLIHILWTNENPVTWLNADVIMVEENRVTKQDDTYVVWNDTIVRGFSFIYIPPLFEVLDGVDPEKRIYDREKTTYVGSVDNWGTAVKYPQENLTYYIQGDLLNYDLQVKGLNADGSERIETYSEEFGYTFPIPDTFTPQVTTTDENGNPQYLKFTGYRAVQLNDGIEETWTGAWDKPVDLQMALDLTDENLPRYLRAIYEDETVKAVFTFIGDTHEPITQYLRRGSAPDTDAVQAVIDTMKAEAAAQGKTLQVEWSAVPGSQMSDTEYLINCRTTYLAPPLVEQVGSEFKVRISANPEILSVGPNDVVTYGFVPNTGELAEVKWLPYGTDTVEVDPEVEYNYFARLVDSETMERTYSAATVMTLSGQREDTGYTTVLNVISDEANPQTPILVTVKLKYTTGTFSEETKILLEPGQTEQIMISSLYTPDQIGSVYMYVTDEDGETIEDSYEIAFSGTSSNGTENWKSKTVYLYADADEACWTYGKLTFTKLQ